MRNSSCCAVLSMAFPGSCVHVIHLGKAGEGQCVCALSRVFYRISAVADSWFSQCNFCLSSVPFLLDSRRYCLETRYLAPRIATAFCLLLHSLNFMKLIECGRQNISLASFQTKNSWNDLYLFIFKKPSTRRLKRYSQPTTEVPSFCQLLGSNLES